MDTSSRFPSSKSAKVDSPAPGFSKISVEKIAEDAIIGADEPSTLLQISSLLGCVLQTVHEMARDEARHGKALKGLLERYFK